MGRKIFISYKYSDDNVFNLTEDENSTGRSYLTELQSKLDESDEINKGEQDGDDLSNLNDDQIWEKLKGRIYDSTLTIVLISPNMKDDEILERDQWIPWEVSYSLKEISRKNKSGKVITSKTNAMLAVVLPDKNNSYDYYLEIKNCCTSKCRTHHTNKLFDIIRKNKFNLNNAEKKECDNSHTVWYGEYSYIKAVKWKNFITDIDKYINESYDRQDNLSDYEIYKEL